nr:contractile injection system protein, VgrG/Pvc8 family [Pseudomonas sp. GL93]
MLNELRTLHGVVTGFKRLSGALDEARYKITLEPRLALLNRGQQFRINQHQSVPQIVESVSCNTRDERLNIDVVVEVATDWVDGVTSHHKGDPACQLIAFTIVRRTCTYPRDSVNPLPIVSPWRPEHAQ